MKRVICAVLLGILMCLLTAAASAQTYRLTPQEQELEIRATDLDGEDWLFLPAFADLSALFPDAEETDETGVWQQDDLYIMQSENLRALFLFSDDPVNRGRAFIDGSQGHQDETTASMMLVDAQGTVDHAHQIRSLRGRGNSTWGVAKKPYQIKLEERADLLDTGIASEANRTWVLLADHYDPSLLRSRISLDLGLEMGLWETSRSEYVDLYYDGEYRGVYLLAEKVEIGEGRIEELDYSEMIEAWNRRVGQMDLEMLPAAQGVNRYGNEIHYVDGLIQTEDPSAGAYLLEMEGSNTLSDRSWFTLSSGGLIGCKNPDNASREMMEYVSARLEEAWQTVVHGGVNPENGRTLEQDFDVEAFARAALIHELSYCDSGYHFSSSFFVLPAGQMQFRPAAVWDFDLAWRYFRLGDNESGIGFKDTDGWLIEFYRLPAFREQMRRIYEEELSPMVTEILLGEKQGRFLRSIESYAEEIRAAQSMNYRLWGQQEYMRELYSTTLDGEVDMLRRFILQRHAWLYDTFVNRSSDEYVHMTLRSYWGSAQEDPVITPAPWCDVQVVSIAQEQLTEATEEEYALWQAELILKTQTENPVFVINGTPLEAEETEQGWKLCYTFEDRFYRPVDYYGEDIGLVYDFETYCRNYPDVAEECGYDPETVMDYFCDEGMYEGHMGNAVVWPTLLRMSNRELDETLGEDWQMYYWEFIDHGYYEGWLRATGAGFHPQLTDAMEEE